MFMQAGFALVETGLTRAKNAAHTMAMNIFVYAIGILGFWSLGFALQMGGVGALGTLGNDSTLSHEFVVHLAGREFGLFGMKGFFLSGTLFTAPVAAMFLFQMVFMDTAATIPTGAMAERWKFLSFVLFSIVVSTIIYPIYGSSVVHMTGGVMAFVGAKVLGPRIGKYTKEGTPRPIPGHNIPMVVVGTIILAFGWFGFNAGSTLAGTDARIAIIAVNTMLASAAGAFASYLVVTLKFGKPDVTMICNGLLSGLVAITAPCAFVGAPAAVAIGAIAGVVVVYASLFVERKLKIDDPVGAISVHGVNGAWGIVALGLFANGTYGDGLNGVEGPVRGLLHGDARQLGASLIGIVVNVAWVASISWLALYGIGKAVGNRSKAEDELQGLDVPELGAPGYGDEPGQLVPPVA